MAIWWQWQRWWGEAGKRQSPHVAKEDKGDGKEQGWRKGPHPGLRQDPWWTRRTFFLLSAIYLYGQFAEGCEGHRGVQHGFATGGGFEASAGRSRRRTQTRIEEDPAVPQQKEEIAQSHRTTEGEFGDKAQTVYLLQGDHERKAPLSARKIRGGRQKSGEFDQRSRDPAEGNGRRRIRSTSHGDGHPRAASCEPGRIARDQEGAQCRTVREGAAPKFPYGEHHHEENVQQSSSTTPNVYGKVGGNADYAVEPACGTWYDATTRLRDCAITGCRCIAAAYQNAQYPQTEDGRSFGRYATPATYWGIQETEAAVSIFGGGCRREPESSGYPQGCHGGHGLKSHYDGSTAFQIRADMVPTGCGLFHDHVNLTRKAWCATFSNGSEGDDISLGTSGESSEPEAEDDMNDQDGHDGNEAQESEMDFSDDEYIQPTAPSGPLQWVVYRPNRYSDVRRLFCILDLVGPGVGSIRNELSQCWDLQRVRYSTLRLHRVHDAALTSDAAFGRPRVYLAEFEGDGRSLIHQGDRLVLIEVLKIFNGNLIEPRSKAHYVIWRGSPEAIFHSLIEAHSCFDNPTNCFTFRNGAFIPWRSICIFNDGDFVQLQIVSDEIPQTGVGFPAFSRDVSLVDKHMLEVSQSDADDVHRNLALRAFFVDRPPLPNLEFSVTSRTSGEAYTLIFPVSGMTLITNSGDLFWPILPLRMHLVCHSGTRST